MELHSEILQHLETFESDDSNRIRLLLDSTSEITLKDVLEQDLPAGLKAWCLAHLKLLSDPVLHHLACDYADHVLAKALFLLGEDNAVPQRLLDETRQYIDGYTDPEKLFELRDELRLLQEKRPDICENYTILSALEAVWNAADTNARDAFVYAGSCARDAVEPQLREQEAAWQLNHVKHYMLN